MVEKLRICNLRTGSPKKFADLRFSDYLKEMSLTKLSLGGNNLYMTSLFPPRESLVSDIPAGDGNIEKLFLRCRRPPELVLVQHFRL
jgi:hypothetical protein